MSILYARNEFKIQNSKFKIVSERSERTLGGYCGGVPPLPIPNREVKPACADGTAMQCGRVGNRLFSVSKKKREMKSSGREILRRTFFVV